MNEFLLPNARSYPSRRQLRLKEQLGSGKDGIVIVGIPQAAATRVAIKVHRFQELYDRERCACERLRERSITTVPGFNVPQLIHYDEELLAIEMTMVKRPFVLDFAAAGLDKRPEFPTEVWADWGAEKREQFEERWPRVEQILSAFEDMGVYLLDVSPANITFA